MGWAGLGLPQRHQGSVPGVGQSLAANTWPAMNIRDILEIVDLERQNVEKTSSPDYRAEGITENFSPIDIDVTTYPATLKRSHTANSRSVVHSREPSSNQSFFAGLKAAFSESPSQPANLSPRLYAGGDWTDASVMGDSNFSSSASSMTSGTSFSSNTTFVPSRSPSAAENAPSGNTQRNMERGNSNSGRSRRSHAHHHSHSRHHKDELKTVGEYALHVLFTSFIAQAEEKISQCVTLPLDPEPQIEHICGMGVDPAFDQLISALGHIASQKPKPLIDSMMLWRKNKSDAANEARIQLQQSRGNLLPGQLPRRNTEPPHMHQDDLMAGLPTIAARQEFVAQAERRSTASIFILCRVLMEVIGQSTLARITPEMEEKLEGIIFGQLKIADADQLSTSPLKMANWFLFSQLLGVMAEINFDSVTDRFIADLEKSQKDLVIKSPVNRDIEGRMVLVLGGMKHIRLKAYPEEAWDQSCDFMINLGKFFLKSHGQQLKYAYCMALEILLLPIAATANTELNMPKWTEVLATIGPRLASMFIKPRHWAVAFPLTATLLCVSPTDTFSTQWLQLVLPLQTKMKEPRTRPICLQVISRLLWTYLHRTNETTNVTIKKLEDVMRLVLPPGKKSYISTDSSIIEPLIQIIRIIGFKYQDFCFRTIVFPLINADLFASGRELKVEQLEPEKMVVGIRAFLAIMSDLEKGEQGCPPFPQHYSQLPVFERMPTSPIMTAPRSPITPSLVVPNREERLSRPVITNALGDVAREYYAKFCEILGKITIICDNTFGGQAVLDEKFNGPIPKTPLAESFNFRRDDHLTPSEQKQGFYELLHVAVQALPRCLSADIPFNILVNLLCTGTAHVQYNIAESSAQSLKSIARQSHAQPVTIGFARFIFTFDDRYSTMSDGGMLGPGHIENTLKLYVELLQIWIEEIKNKMKDAALDISEDGRVRAFAVTVLRLITEFDTALGKDNGRLIHILEGDAKGVMDFNDETLSVAERSRLQRGLQKTDLSERNESDLIELCSSDVSYDTTLWFKIFPNLIRISYDRCPFAVTLGRELICNRILQMYRGILVLSEANRGPQYGYDTGSGRWPTTIIAANNATLSKGIKAKSNIGKNHLRKDPLQVSHSVTLRGPASIRDAVVVALGAININIYKTLLEELQGVVSRCNDDARARIHQRSSSGPRRNRRTDLLRTEVTHVYKLTASFLKEKEVYEDDWILNNLVIYTKDLKIFLMDGEVQLDWEFQKLRRHYCGLMEELFEGINLTKDPSRWMTFESRKSSFALMEDWCGYSPNQNQIRQREDNMRQSMINQQSLGERGVVTAAMEIEKRNLRTAALSAMAALCGGRVSITTESGANLQFDIRRMLSWCYLAEAAKVLQSYFGVVTEVLIEYPDYPMPFWRLLGIGLYTLGSELGDIRIKSARILRALEERQQRSSKIQDFDISISDKTKAVYKLAQFEISKRLSTNHSELAFMIFSEFTMYFKELQAGPQRNMVAAILPWIQIIELQLDPNGGPTAQSYVLLANLFEITIRCSSTLHNEVQALWQALATGPHAGNVQLVLDFIMSLCLDRREQNFVEYAKQIVVFLSSTPAGGKVVEFLLMQITPKAMVPNEKREFLPPPPDVGKLPYMAELSEALPIGNKQTGLSLGQLSLILLVDLMVSPVQLVADNVPLLLQVVAVLWDHYIPLVQEQAREMLIHLIHELVISQIDDESTNPSKNSIEDFIESIRRHDPKVIWHYDDNSGKVYDQENKVPPGMELLTSEVVRDFEVKYPGIQEQWAKLSLTWATSCPVRHLACRSFQVFRCTLTSLDQSMLADMLIRLSNTIADLENSTQLFSIEILTTLRTLIRKLQPADLLTFPQLFWTTCACLDTINEQEFLEAGHMLEELLAKLDLDDPSVRDLLAEGRPTNWEGSFGGVQALVYKGVRSSACLDMTLATLNKLITLPSDELIGDDSRLLFAVLANFPGFLNAMDQPNIDQKSIQTAEILAGVAEAQGCSTISRALIGFAGSRYRSSKDFLAQLVSALRESFFPKWEFRSLTFVMGSLTNSIPWFKLKTMRILCAIIPDIDMKKSEIASHGPDLISPLLRLLQTEFCMEALEVLDKIMTMTGTPMDKHHLRMSMTRSSSRAMRKEYDNTQSLFGIPEDSGWSIPMPAKQASITRSNVHAVFYMCQSTKNTDHEVAATPDVEFHVDDFQYGYFPQPERTETMMSDEARGDGNIGDLMMKLDSLDDFFEDSLQSPTSDGRSSRTITEVGFSGENFDSAAAQLYDEQTLPILHQSLTHSATNSTFQNGFADLRPTRESNNAMTPAAFNLVPTSRPSLHARALTSPSTSSGHPSITYMSDDDFSEDVFSDGEEDRATASGEGSFFLENMIKPLAAGTRLGMRRLTGGRSRDNERFRESLRAERRGISQPPRSPRVPKVPTAYLQPQKPLSPEEGL
ncbi:cell morphogenesis protein pag1 [Botrytis cinerea]